MAEIDNEKVKSKRELMNERLQQRYPDMDLTDDEVVFGRISDDYDAYDKDIAGYQEREKAFSDLFTKDPRSASFVMAWKNGEHPMTAFIRRFGKDGLEELVNNEDKLEEFAKAEEEYLARVAKEKELEENYQKNLSESLDAIGKLQQERGLSDEQVDKAMEWLIGVIKDGIVGKFSPESLDMAMKAINHDADVDAANQEGLVQGKNTKIEEKLRKPKMGDGTAALGGSNGAAAPAKTRPSLGVLDNFGDNNQTIWERGGEKRVRY